MAVSDIDQKILAQMAKDVARSNALLSSALYQVLGLSVLLSQKLYRARRSRRLDTSRDTRYMSLYHHIIWLSREGLAITEVMVLPYCQNGSQTPRCRVMAAKLRASFYHVFCLFHNHPPISQLTPPKTSPNDRVNSQDQVPWTDARARQAVLRDAIPSMTSEASYITNPYATSGPAQSSPPPYPPPPVPTAPTTPINDFRVLASGSSTRSPAQPSPPSSADFLMPPLNFVPVATVYFSQATILAKRLLPGSDPLRLSVAYESCEFSWECVKDFALAKQKAKSTIKDVYAATEGMDDAEFEDAASLVQAIAAIAKRSDSTQVSNPSLPQRLSTPEGTSPANSATQTTPSRPVSVKTTSGRIRRPRSRASQKALQTSARKQEKMPAIMVTETDAPTSGPVSSARPPPPPPPPPPKDRSTDPPAKRSPGRPSEPKVVATAAKTSPRRSRANSRSSPGTQGSRASSTATAMTEKERKRRIMEQAEERVRRRNVSASQASTFTRT